jgi:hypothetical protein
MAQMMIPPIFGQATERLRGGELRNNRALQAALARRLYETRTIPDILNNQASRGSFYSGATTNKVSRAAEDFTTTEGMAELATSTGLADILRNQFLIGLGIQL